MFDPNNTDRITAACKRGDDLSQGHLSTLRNALIVAKERYTEHRDEFQANADRCKAEPDFVKAHEGGMIDPSIYPRMATQFAQQAEDVQALIDWIDGPDDGEVQGREIDSLTITRRIVCN